MKRVLKFLLISISLLLSAQLQAQDQGFEQYRKAMQKEFKNYSDSVNASFAKYLEETWKRFELFRKEVSFKPMPQPPVFDPTKPKPDATPLPAPVMPRPPVAPLPAPPIPPPAPAPAAKYPVAIKFFGTTVRLQAVAAPGKSLSGISEKEVAGYWQFLSGLPAEKWTDDILRIKNELNLNDWGVYLLANRLFRTYFPDGTENEQTVYATYVLNRLGYRARIGRADNELVALVAFQNELFNTPYFTFSNTGGQDVTYYVLNPHHKEMASVRTYDAEFDDPDKVMNISVEQPPHFLDEAKTKDILFRDEPYTLAYNQNLTDFYATYPCVDLAVYANAPLDTPTKKTLDTAVKPKLNGRSQEEAVNFLLHFVQNAFQYKTDDEQFGYEKWNFAEETILSAFSDCDDRAILFAQLVKYFLGMKVVLVYYPGYHLATAVKFDNPQTTGDYFLIDGAKYLICDPTYINADLGNAMPQLRDMLVEIIQLKN